MDLHNRRAFLGYAAWPVVLPPIALQAVAAHAQTASGSSSASVDPAVVDRWMRTWMEDKALVGRLFLSRFVEPVYFLLEPIVWEPNPGAQDLPAVQVPRGFVTDFASIPRIFWSVLRPDGEYAHAAVIHDYLYWSQTTPKAVADSIFKRAMEDLKVAPATVATLYNAVKLFGDQAWQENARLKGQGEKRILKRFPDDAATRWADWKTRPDVLQ